MQPVRILVKSPFPSLIRVSEEAFSLKSGGELFMKSKFLAIIARYGVNMFLIWEQCSGKSLRDTGSPFVRRKGDDAETGLSFN